MSEESPAKPTYEELLEQLAQLKQQLTSRLERAQETEVTLRQGEERHRLALAAGAMATWDWHVPSGEVVWNDEHFRMLGYEPGAITPGYQAWADRIHPEDRVATENLVRANVEQGGEYRSEFRALLADGTVRWIEARGRTERDAAGEPLRQYGVMLDITERKRAEEEQRRLAGELADRVGELQAILDHAPIAIWIAHDPECRKITGNAVASQVIMRTGMGANISRSAPADETPVSYKVVRNGVDLRPEELPAQIAARTGEAVPGEEMELVFSDGRRVPMILGATPLFDAEGHPRGSITAGAEITRLKQTEAALVESHGRTTAILESIADAFYSLDDEWRFVVVNPAAERAPLGRPASELLGKVIWEVFPSIQGTRIHQHYLDAVEKRSREHYEEQSPLNGRWYEVFMFPRAGGLDVYLRDITERRRAEEALRESERLLNDVIDGSPMPIFLKDLDGRFLTANRRLEGLLGITREELKGKTDDDIISRDNADIYREHDRQVIESGQPLAIEETAALADGHHVFLNSKFPLIDSAGRVYGVGAISHDITDRKRAEERLRESEQQLRDIIDASPTSIVFLKDLEGRFITANKRLEDLLGISREALRGKTDFDLFPPEKAEYYREHDRRIVETGEPLMIEEVADLADGKRHTFLAAKFPLHDPSGRMYGVGAVSQDITVVKEAEEMLRRHLEEVETLMQVAPVAIWVASDAKCHDIIGNQTANAFYDAGEGENVSAGPAPGKPVPPRQFFMNGREVAADELPMQVAAARNIDVVGSEFDVVLSNGTRRTLSGNASPLRDSDGNVRGCIGAFVDVTLRKQAEGALRRFELLASHSRDIVLFMRRADGRILEANTAAQSAYGYSREEMLSLSIIDLRAPHARSLTNEQMAIADTRGILFETVHQCKDGRTFPVEVSSSGATIDGTRMLISVVRDITERKQVEEALRRSEEKFRHLADAMPQLVWTAEPDGTVDYINRRHETLRGARRGDDGMWTLQPVIHPDDLRATLAAWGHAVRTGHDYEVEQRLLLADGAFRWHLARATAIRDERGRIVKWYGTTTDIHQLKEVQQALRDADRNKSDFLAMLSHELRNPLAPIRNSAYILEHAAPGGEQARRALAVIDRQAGQMARLVDDLLDVTRITRNKIHLQRQTLELNELVQHTMEDQRSLFEKAEVHLELHPASRPVIVNADRSRLAQVVSNLLQNAAKFTGRGGTTSITIRVDAAAKRAVIQVTDTGVGMAPEMVSRLFQPFSQAESSLDRSKGGLGLGLALVKGLVDLHGGEVEARSAGLGKGAEFTVRLPLAMAEAVAPRPHPKATTRGRRVLIIEDNIDAADSLREVLEFGEHEVVAAYNGPEGIAKARETRPDVVLCDIGLPGMDGYEVARAFRADDGLKSIYLVALSGYALPEDLERAQVAGFDRHLAKPPSLEKIEALLAEVTRRSFE